MMTELCQELRNWFDRGMDKWEDSFSIVDGELVGFSDKLQDGQYFRVQGSVFNDGVHQYGAPDLRDEAFKGSIWAMAVPSAVIALSSQIDEWETKYGGPDGPGMTPYASESFGGYSYSKAAGSAQGGSGGVTWQSMFRSQLNRWRKI